MKSSGTNKTVSGSMRASLIDVLSQINQQALKSKIKIENEYNNIMRDVSNLDEKSKVVDYKQKYDQIVVLVKKLADKVKFKKQMTTTTTTQPQQKSSTEKTTQTKSSFEPKKAP